jgi:molybdopterin-guanine dinucleotide biosynthesis protein
MQLVSISAIRNSGKTSLIVALSKFAGRQGKRAAVIVNENGRATYEPCEKMPHVVDIQYVRGG